MSISQRGSTTSASSSSANSAGCSRPTGVQSGDVLLALVTSNDGTISSNGWTVVGHGSGQPDLFDATWLYKVAGSSEPSTYTFSNNSGSGPPIVVSITAWQGVDTSGSPIGGSAFSGSGSAAEPLSTGTCTSAPVGLPIYSRSCRVPNDSSPGHPVTFSSSDTELDDQGQWSGGTVSYSHGIYKGVEASGNPPALNITASGSKTESDNVVAVLTLKTLITNATVNAGVAQATASAHDAAGTPGRAAFADVAQASAGAGTISFTPLKTCRATATAHDASVHIGTGAGTAAATADAADIALFYGTPPGRIFTVPSEDRTYEITR